MGRSKDLATGTFTTALDVQGAITSDGLTVDTSDQVIINHSGDAGGLRIDSTNNTNTGSIRFGDVADNYIGAVEYNHTSDALSFYANNATRMTINSSGYVTKPNQPHILGSPVNSAGSGIADAFYTHVNYPPIGLSFSNSRITVPIAGVYLINFNSIADQSTIRRDIRVKINGSTMGQSLSNTSPSNSYNQNNVSLAIKLDENDYIQFDHDDWYNSGSTGYDSWKTASVTLLG